MMNFHHLSLNKILFLYFQKEDVILRRTKVYNSHLRDVPEVRERYFKCKKVKNQENPTKYLLIFPVCFVGNFALEMICDQIIHFFILSN